MRVLRQYENGWRQGHAAQLVIKDERTIGSSWPPLEPRFHPSIHSLSLSHSTPSIRAINIRHPPVHKQASMPCHEIDDANNNAQEFKHEDCDIDNIRQKLITCPTGTRRVLQVGLTEWFDDRSKRPFDGISRIVLIVPGNPGEILFYKRMMHQLHERLGIPVIGAGYSGLSKRCQRLTSGPLTVRRLVEDEITLIEDFIPAEVEIILVGHSIGTFIATEMMKVSLNRERFVHSVMMMPILQGLRYSTGAYVMRTLFYAPIFFYVFIFLLSLLPDRVLHRIISGTCDLLWDRTNCSVEAAVQITDLSTIRNAFALAADEFNQVQDMDMRFLSRNQKRLSFVFAEVDEWVPRNYVSEFKDTFPDADAVILPQTLHTFFFSQKMTDDIIDAVCKPLDKFKVDSERALISE